MLDFAEELASFKPCTCRPRPLDLCERAIPCPRREGPNVAAYCASCTLDLAHGLANLDVPPVDSIPTQAVPRVRAAIALSLCRSCADVARAQLADLIEEAPIVALAPARRIGGAH